MRAILQTILLFAPFFNVIVTAFGVGTVIAAKEGKNKLIGFGITLASAALTVWSGYSHIAYIAEINQPMVDAVSGALNTPALKQSAEEGMAFMAAIRAWGFMVFTSFMGALLGLFLGARVSKSTEPTEPAPQTA